jgi:hypothetical protein
MATKWKFKIKDYQIWVAYGSKWMSINIKTTWPQNHLLGRLLSVFPPVFYIYTNHIFFFMYLQIVSLIFPVITWLFIPSQHFYYFIYIYINLSL